MGFKLVGRWNNYKDYELRDIIFTYYGKNSFLIEKNNYFIIDASINTIKYNII